MTNDPRGDGAVGDAPYPMRFARFCRGRALNHDRQSLEFDLVRVPVARDGLLLSFSVDGMPLQAWVDEAQFRDFLSPVLPTLPVSDWDALDDAMRSAIAALAVPGWPAAGAPAGVVTPVSATLSRGRATQGPQLRVIHHRQDARLAMYLAGCTDETLAALACATHALDREATWRVRAALAAGFVSLPADQRDGLQAGAALLLERAADPWAEEVWVRGATHWHRARRVSADRFVDTGDTHALVDPGGAGDAVPYAAIGDGLVDADAWSALGTQDTFRMTVDLPGKVRLTGLSGRCAGASSGRLAISGSNVFLWLDAPLSSCERGGAGPETPPAPEHA
jgi:hypothetical protein